MMKRKNRIWLFKKSIALVCSMIFLFINNINGQSLKGVTGKRDTSYTTYSAWAQLKNNPEITIVHEFNFSDVAEKKRITFCTINHRNLLIDAFMPKEKSSKKAIAVIMIHGGGWRSGNRSQHYPLAQSLAHLGYVCFTPEYRLSTEALFPAAVYDIKAAIRWVKENATTYHVDTSKIVIAGFSSGGELAAFMGTTGNMPLFEGCDCNNGATTNVLR